MQESIIFKYLTDIYNKFIPSKHVKNKVESAVFPYMNYNIFHKCIFIHIPKAAGTSILNRLGYSGGRHHCGYVYYKMCDSIKFDSYFKFSIVRNPFDRLKSSYNYLKNGGNQMEDLYFKDIFEKQCPNFESFVLNFLNDQVIHEIRVLNPQYLFLYDYKRDLQVNYIGKFECLNEDFKVISDKIGLEYKPLDLLNRSQFSNCDIYYNNYSITKKVLDLYKRDFEFFSYSTIPPNY